MKNFQIKTEIITLIFIILCTVGVICKDYLPHNVFTSAFIHGSKDHFINNMMLFLLLSPAVEEKLGKVNYLLSFALTTVTVHYFHTGLLHVNAIGISAWIFALIVLNIGKLKITGILLISIYVHPKTGPSDTTSLHPFGKKHSPSGTADWVPWFSAILSRNVSK